MDLETAQTTTTAKLPILKQGEYDMWRLRIEQYFQVLVIIRNDQKKNDVKAKKKYVMMALLIKHSMTLNYFTKMLRLCLLLYKQDLVASEDFIEQEVKGTASSSSNSQNMAFVSSPSSTDEVNTAYGWSSNLVYEDLEQNPMEDTLEEMDLKWQLALLSMRTRRFFQKTGRKITINRSDTAGYDKNQDSSRRTVNVEEISFKAMLAIDGAGFDWSYIANDEVPTNMALMAFSDSEIPDKSRKGLGFVSYNTVPPPPRGLFSPSNLDLSNSGLEEFQQPEFKGYGSKTKFVRAKQQEKPIRKPVKYAEMYRLTAITIKGKG
ncbi:hypothetical protein Tco_0720296 [Tanacetum coccineum]